jgi:DNA repair protein RecN (Recombination protein N)
MLVELRIENLGVIESVATVFGPGLTVLTGETGAGKTMVVEALQLLLGGRADPTVVRTVVPKRGWRGASCVLITMTRPTR